MNTTLKNLTKLRIAGMLSEAARLEVEKKIKETLNPEDSSETSDKLSFGWFLLVFQNFFQF